MGCNCGGGKQGPRVVARQRVNPHRVPQTVIIQNWSAEPKLLIGAKTGVSYGQRKDGDQIKIWKSDVLEAPNYFEVIG